jgi:hypothetical protein
MDSVIADLDTVPGHMTRWTYDQSTSELVS